MNEEGRYLQIMMDYESFLGVKLVGQQVDQLRQAREERSNIDNQESKDGGTTGLQSSYGGATSTGLYDRNSTAQSRGLSRTGQQTYKNDEYTEEYKKDDRIAIKASAMESFDSTEERKKRGAAKGGKISQNLTGYQPSLLDSNAEGSAIASEDNEQNGDGIPDHNNEDNAD